MQSFPSSSASSSPGSTWGRDFGASIVVFLVALPLCMGIAIASGAPVSAGLITGIIGGLVVGTLAGCPLQVSGPAAGLTVIVYDAIQRFGLEMLGPIVLIAGAAQVLAGAVGLGQWFRAVSPAVVKGMLAGIGVLIFGSQFHVMVDDKPRENGIANLVSIPESVAKVWSGPEVGSPESREIRTRLLREFGELHRRQIRLQEQVAEAVPDHTADELAQVTLTTEERAPLVEEQRRILDEIEQRRESLLEAGTLLRNKSRRGAIDEAAAETTTAVRAALVELEAGSPAALLPAQSRAVEGIEELQASLKDHSLAGGLGLLAILVIVGWQSFAPKKLRVVPGPLLAILLATGIAASLGLPLLYVEIPDNLWDEVRLVSLGVLSDVPWAGVVQAGLVIAVVASAETLLCATACDQMHDGARTRYDRELLAQGTGNVLCGFLGALPMTGVIVRSAANVQAGAKSRWSAVLHGAWLLLFVVAFGFLLRTIPTAGLAAILVYTGVKLVDIKSIKELRRYGWGEVVIYAATLVTIVAVDLLAGVIVGIVLSGLKLLHTFSRLRVRLRAEPEKRRAVLTLSGAATFVRLPKLATALENVPANSELHVDFEQLDYIDHACLDLLMTWARSHQATGGSLVIDWSSLHARFHSGPALRLNNGADTRSGPDAGERHAREPKRAAS
ncbi:MAG: SulP family inorganic anion transporter [Planctomycetaceae bacterium]